MKKLIIYILFPLYVHGFPNIGYEVPDDFPTITIDIIDSVDIPSYIEIELLKSILGDGLNQNIPFLNQKYFLRSWADANLAANVSIGPDYTYFKIFYLGLSGTLVSNIGITDKRYYNNTPKKKELLPIGAALAFTFTSGVSFEELPLGKDTFLSLRRLHLHFAWMGSKYTEPFLYKNDGRTQHLSFRIGYTLFPPAYIGDYKYLKFDGLFFYTGYVYGATKFRYEQGHTEQVNFQNFLLRWPASISWEISSEGYVIPLEFATSIEILYVLNIFTGIGIDITRGKAYSHLYINGPIELIYEEETIKIGTATVDSKENNESSYSDIRLFAGIQLDLFAFKLSVKGTWTFRGSWGMALESRVYW